MEAACTCLLGVNVPVQMIPDHDLPSHCHYSCEQLLGSLQGPEQVYYGDS